MAVDVSITSYTQCIDLSWSITIILPVPFFPQWIRAVKALASMWCFAAAGVLHVIGQLCGSADHRGAAGEQHPPPPDRGGDVSGLRVPCWLTAEPRKTGTSWDINGDVMGYITTNMMYDVSVCAKFEVIIPRVLDKPSEWISDFNDHHWSTDSMQIVALFNFGGLVLYAFCMLWGSIQLWTSVQLWLAWQPGHDWDDDFQLSVFPHGRRVDLHRS